MKVGSMRRKQSPDRQKTIVASRTEVAHERNPSGDTEQGTPKPARNKGTYRHNGNDYCRTIGA